jgi:hypothetical protein
MTMCPATMLAKRRTVSAKGFVKSPKNSITNISGQSARGTPEGTRCVQYATAPCARMPAICVRMNVNSARTIVTDTFPVAVEIPGKPPTLGTGNRPDTFMKRMKKNAEQRYGV